METVLDPRLYSLLDEFRQWIHDFATLTTRCAFSVLLVLSVAVYSLCTINLLPPTMAFMHVWMYQFIYLWRKGCISWFPQGHPSCCSFWSSWQVQKGLTTDWPVSRWLERSQSQGKILLLSLFLVEIQIVQVKVFIKMTLSDLCSVQGFATSNCYTWCTGTTARE